MTFKSHYFKHSERQIQYFTVVPRLFVYSSVKCSADLCVGVGGRREWRKNGKEKNVKKANDDNNYNNDDTKLKTIILK